MVVKGWQFFCAFALLFGLVLGHGLVYRDPNPYWAGLLIIAPAVPTAMMLALAWFAYRRRYSVRLVA